LIISDVPEVFNDLKMLPAMDTVENLTSPLYDTDYLPHEKVFEWVITASSDNVVTNVMIQKNLSKPNLLGISFCVSNRG
jgi:radical SAM superfamily enzyme YgiQ (UPF0313 family)